MTQNNPVNYTKLTQSKWYMETMDREIAVRKQMLSLAAECGIPFQMVTTYDIVEALNENDGFAGRSTLDEAKKLVLAVKLHGAWDQLEDSLDWSSTELLEHIVTDVIYYRH